jgi:hypothetical protein
VIFSLGMYLVVYGLRNAGLTEYLSGVLNLLAEKGLWAATFGTGFLTAFLSSVMNNMPTVLIGALSIDGYGDWRRQRGNDLCQRDWLRFRPENHPDWQSGNPALAACACPEKYNDYLGLLLPHRHYHDSARAVCHSGRAGVAALHHFVMRYRYEQHYHLSQPCLRHFTQHAGDDP